MSEEKKDRDNKDVQMLPVDASKVHKLVEELELILFKYSAHKKKDMEELSATYRGRSDEMDAFLDKIESAKPVESLSLEELMMGLYYLANKLGYAVEMPERVDAAVRDGARAMFAIDVKMSELIRDKGRMPSRQELDVMVRGLNLQTPDLRVAANIGKMPTAPSNDELH